MAKEERGKILTFSSLLLQNRSRLFGYIYSMLHNWADAEDVYQQTTVLLWEKFDEFETGSDFARWALKVAYFNVKNFQRVQGSRQRYFQGAVMEKLIDSFEETGNSPAEDRLLALIACIKKLSAKKRAILNQRYFEDLPVKELAESVGLQEGAMHTALSRIRKALFQCVNSRLSHE